MAKKQIEPGSRDLRVNLYDGDTLDDIRYGRWKDSKTGRYLVPSLLSGSDYSGSLVERSNHDVFTDAFAAGQDVWWTNAPGGHGTFAIVIDLESIPEEVNEEVVDFFRNLDEYPLADEERHSELEREAEDAAWGDWGRKDFRRELEKKFGVELDDVDDAKIDELFFEAQESSNTYWINEQGDSMYIDLARVVKAVSRSDVDDLIANAA